jgi:outer membrane lipoprotein-sorting protein
MRILVFFFSIVIFFNSSVQSFALDVSDFCSYLSSIQALKANFVEIIDGKKNEGVIFLKKPERVLIDYRKGDIAAKIAINGKKVVFLDKKAEQITHLEHGFYNFFHIFSDDKLCKSGFVGIENNDLCIIDLYNQQKYRVCFDLKDDNAEMLIKIDLIYGDKNVEKFVNYSEIKLIKIRKNIDLSNDIFNLRDPRLFKNEF